MKYHCLTISFIFIFAYGLLCACSSDEITDPAEKTPSIINSGTIFFENGICKCPEAQVGDEDTIDGKRYKAVNDSSIRAELAAGNVYLCTTLVTDMSGSLLPLTNFFNNTSFNAPIGFWDVSNVTNMDGMFFGAEVFNQDLSKWDVSKVTNMGSLFKNASRFNQNISGWNTSNVTKMLDAFRSAKVFNQDISPWNTQNVTTMDAMFQDASAFNQNLSNWCVTNIESEPVNFALDAPLNQDQFPIWGTCPF
ncbi:MAG: BspA family leucine-rich repeat surface protein [Flavobacteriaceae bacterium]